MDAEAKGVRVKEVNGEEAEGGRVNEEESRTCWIFIFLVRVCY